MKNLLLMNDCVRNTIYVKQSQVKLIAVVTYTILYVNINICNYYIYIYIKNLVRIKVHVGYCNLFSMLLSWSLSNKQQQLCGAILPQPMTTLECHAISPTTLHPCV